MIMPPQRAGLKDRKPLSVVLERAGAVTESFLNVFGSEMGKLVQNVLDREAVGQIIEDQGDGDPRTLDDRLAVHDVFISHDS